MSSSASSLITVATFSGMSKYAQDFQSVLTRAVQLQSLNLENIQQQQQNVSDRQAALQALDSKVANFQSSLAGLSTATGLASLTATTSDPSVADVSISDGATPATYTLEVTDVGSHSQSISSDNNSVVSDPNSQNIASGPFGLSVGGGSYAEISPANNTLQGLADAINANSSLGVSASIVNIGNSGSPDYRLSLQATKLGNVSIDLSTATENGDGTITPGTSLVQSVATGTLAAYHINGLSRTITSDSDTIALAPGVSVDLLGTNAGSPLTVSVSQNTAALQKAVQTVANTYNAVVAQLATSYGSGANALQGDSILFSIKSALQSIQGYQGGSGSGLATLGLDLDTSGHLTFNSTEFNATASQGISAFTHFLGDTNSGFLQLATSSLNGLEDPDTGSIKNEERQFAASLSQFNITINDEVDRINTFQQNLLTQLSQSDAAIYQLQNQETLYKGLFNPPSNNDN